MSLPNIVLTAELLGGEIRSWASTSMLRIGRLPDLEIVIKGDSVSRRHAEVVFTDEGWLVRDLGSSNGTYLNGARLGRTGQRIRLSDEIRVGVIVLKVSNLVDQSASTPVGVRAELMNTMIPWASDHEQMKLDVARKRYDHDISSSLRLLRNGYRLSNSKTGNLDTQKLLDEAIVHFGAQRGGLLFVAEPTQPLELRFVSVAPDRLTLPRSVSKSAASRTFERKESLLFKDTQKHTEFANAESVVRSVTASIICAIVRSPSHVFGVLHLDRGPHQEPFTESDLFQADAFAEAIGVGLDRIRLAEKHQQLLVQTVTALAQAVEMRDEYTGNHTNRVTKYSLLLAEELGLPEEKQQILRVAAALHDIGKIAIDDQILRKPGRLTEAEFTQMKTHVIRGAEIIEMMPGLAWALPVVRNHHERWDGRGYPDNLAGTQIPLMARVVCVADAFDAMTSNRPYRKGMSADVAFEELRNGVGKQFDPECVHAFLRIEPKIRQLLDDEKKFLGQVRMSSDTITAKELSEAANSVLDAPLEEGVVNIRENAFPVISLDDSVF